MRIIIYLYINNVRNQYYKIKLLIIIQYGKIYLNLNIKIKNLLIMIIN